MANSVLELVHGEVLTLSPLVRRITAPNPSLMTGAGTNTYILGKGDTLTVLDPGPAISEHIDAILNVGSEKIKHVVVTHTHPDHSPAALPIKEATGAQLLGNVVPDDGYQDTTFVSDHHFDHDEVWTAGGFSLRALHTPGHVSNHYCFLLEDEGMLFTGDHLMEGTTVVIIPPHGDMADYIASLRMLLDYDISTMAPAHGRLMEEPKAILEWTIDHRMARERKVLAALEKNPGSDLEQLVPMVYNDVRTELHGVAKMSLWAHLLKLRKEGRVREDGERWSLN